MFFSQLHLYYISLLSSAVVFVCNLELYISFVSYPTCITPLILYTHTEHIPDTNSDDKFTHKNINV